MEPNGVNHGVDHLGVMERSNLRLSSWGRGLTTDHSVNFTKWMRWRRKGRGSFKHLSLQPAAWSAAFPWSVLLCSSNVICPSLVCADHFHTKNFLGNAISWSALPLVFIALIPVHWYTSYLSAHPPESPYQVTCSHCSYHCSFHAMLTYAHWLPHCPRRLHGLNLCWEQSRTAQ